MYLVNVRRAQKSHLPAIKKAGDMLKQIVDKDKEGKVTIEVEEIAQLLYLLEQEWISDEDLERIYTEGYDQGISESLDERFYDSYNHGYDDALKGIRNQFLNEDYNQEGKEDN